MISDQITLKEGDYVSTEGMTEEQYHAVARAFESAGCPRFCPKDGKGTGEILEWYDGALFSCLTPEEGGRHLTIDQVLGAVNAGHENDTGATMTATRLDTITDPIATLKQARQARDEAEQAYQEALGEAREFIGDGFELTEVGIDGPLVDGEDMTDPANWREGDVVECVSASHNEPDYFTVGGRYKLVTNDGSDRFRYIDNDGDEMWVDNCAFRFHHRPA